MNNLVSTVRNLALLLFFVANGAFGELWEWRSGRATRYGGPDDFWTIHNGHCHHKYLSKDVKTGWDVAAMTDVHYDLGWKGMCGRCFEFKCRNAVFKDNYGETLDRGSVCYDQSASVVVQITDKCPCDYPPNYYSNKRWCCGDMDHFDLSVYAFEKMAENKWGVIGIDYREVPCGYQPSNPAKLPDGQSQTPGPNPPANYDKWWDDPRPWPN